MNKVENVNKIELRRYLFLNTYCKVQHDGWSCGTCFYDLVSNLNLNKNSELYWKAILWYRGDYDNYNWKKYHPKLNIDIFPELIKEFYNKIKKEQ